MVFEKHILSLQVCITFVEHNFKIFHSKILRIILLNLINMLDLSLINLELIEIYKYYCQADLLLHL